MIFHVFIMEHDEIFDMFKALSTYKVSGVVHNPEKDVVVPNSGAIQILELSANTTLLCAVLLESSKPVLLCFLSYLQKMPF